MYPTQFVWASSSIWGLKLYVGYFMQFWMGSRLSVSDSFSIFSRGSSFWLIFQGTVASTIVTPPNRTFFGTLASLEQISPTPREAKSSINAMRFLWKSEGYHNRFFIFFFCMRKLLAAKKPNYPCFRILCKI